MATATAHRPWWLRFNVIQVLEGSFPAQGQLSTDERLLRDTAEHGRSEVRQELAYAAQERWLVKRSLLDKFEVDASTLTIMAHCIP